MNALQHIQYPWLLPLALLLPIAGIALLISWARRREARLSRLGSEALVKRLAPEAGRGSVAWRAIRLSLALALGALAFAGPRWGTERTIVQSKGVDVVLALDASLSMLATDERPNRLERMKQEVRRLRALSPGDRMALLAFAGRSYILTPLTGDDGAIDLFLENLDPTVVGQAGSSLARAISQGTDLLSLSREAGDRAIVLMSDGEAFEPVADVEDAARKAAEAGISLVTVGFGSPQGTTIPVREGNTVTEKRDESGAVVVTKYHPELLRAAADAAHGTFVGSEQSDKAARIRNALSGLRAQQRAFEAGREQSPRFQLFLLPAVLLLLLDTYLAERRRPRRSHSVASLDAPAAAAMLLLVLFVGACTGDDPADPLRAYAEKRYADAARIYRARIEHGDVAPRTLYNFGTSLLAADSLRSARDAIERAIRAQETLEPKKPDPELKHRMLFNSGLIDLKNGLALKGDSAKPSLEAALATYRRVLLARPADGDAKWNYELALRKKKDSGGGGGGGGGGNNQSSQAPNPSPSSQSEQPKPAGGLGQRQAEQLLNSAAREERDVQGKKQRQNPPPPRGGKDW